MLQTDYKQNINYSCSFTQATEKDDYFQFANVNYRKI